MNEFLVIAEQFKAFLGDKATMPLIEIIRHYFPDVDDKLKNTFQTEFKTLMILLDLAEAMGKTRLERLNTAIEEWYEEIEDEDKISLHSSVFDKSPSELIDEHFKIGNLPFIVASIAKVENELQDEVGEWLLNLMQQALNGSIRELNIDLTKIDVKYHSMSKEEFFALPTAEKINLIGQLIDAPPAFIAKFYNGLIDALRFSHQKSHFNRLLAYKKSIVIDESESENLAPDIKKIEAQLPKLKQRMANDGITSLSLTQTALFFNMLREHKIIFKDESYQTKENIYKAIQILTGYNKQNIKTAMNLKEYEASDKVVVQNFIKKTSVS